MPFLIALLNTVLLACLTAILAWIKHTSRLIVMAILVQCRSEQGLACSPRITYPEVSHFNKILYDYQFDFRKNYLVDTCLFFNEALMMVYDENSFSKISRIPWGYQKVLLLLIVIWFYKLLLFSVYVNDNEQMAVKCNLFSYVDKTCLVFQSDDVRGNKELRPKSFLSKILFTTIFE